MDEESQVRGCCNFYLHTNQPGNSVGSPLNEHMNTVRNSKQTTCFSRDTGRKGTLSAQRTGFNTLDNWGHKTPTHPIKKDKGQERKD